MSQELSTKLESAVVAVVDSARKAESITPAYVKTGKLIAGFLTMYTSDDSHKRADGIKIVQDRLTSAGLYANATRYLKAYAVCTLAPDAESLPISAVIALAPMAVVGADGEARTAGRYTAKNITGLVASALEKHWHARKLAQEVKAIRQSNITPEEERNAKIRERERKTEKLRSILEKCKPDTLASIIAASKKLQAKLTAILNPKPQEEQPQEPAKNAA